MNDTLFDLGLIVYGLSMAFLLGIGFAFDFSSKIQPLTEIHFQVAIGFVALGCVLMILGLFSWFGKKMVESI
ncbi:MAG TPA: hypothetical protein VEP90_30795 [Methylomirabilota bacterium]|nr:hypothetical protein [Methylomirabilota bacterium]